MMSNNPACCDILSMARFKLYVMHVRLCYLLSHEQCYLPIIVLNHRLVTYCRLRTYTMTRSWTCHPQSWRQATEATRGISRTTVQCCAPARHFALASSPPPCIHHRIPMIGPTTPATWHAAPRARKA